MKRFLFQVWRILPAWLQRLASIIIRPRYEVVVGAVIFNEQGQILLCKHTYKRQYPWGLPGGDIQFGEDPEDAIRRELREETGLSVRECRLLLVEGSKKVRCVRLTYVGTEVSGSFSPNEEVSKIEYFDIAALPDLLPEQQRTIGKTLTILKSEAR